MCHSEDSFCSHFWNKWQLVIMTIGCFAIMASVMITAGSVYVPFIPVLFSFIACISIWCLILTMISLLIWVFQEHPENAESSTVTADALVQHPIVCDDAVKQYATIADDASEQCPTVGDDDAIEQYATVAVSEQYATVDDDALEQYATADAALEQSSTVADEAFEQYTADYKIYEELPTDSAVEQHFSVTADPVKQSPALTYDVVEQPFTIADKPSETAEQSLKNFNETSNQVLQCHKFTGIPREPDMQSCTENNQTEQCITQSLTGINQTSQRITQSLTDINQTRLFMRSRTVIYPGRQRFLQSRTYINQESEQVKFHTDTNKADKNAHLSFTDVTGISEVEIIL